MVNAMRVELKKKTQMEAVPPAPSGSPEGDAASSIGEKGGDTPSLIRMPVDILEMERLAAAAVAYEGVDALRSGTASVAGAPPAEEQPTLTILDFAGQRMYYQMHHIFITAALSIYVAVFNLAHDPGESLEGEDAECGATRLENLHFWLNSIHAQAPDAPIYVVGTHRASVDAVTLAARKAQIEASFEGQAFDGQLCSGSEIVCVDNKTDAEVCFDGLRGMLAAEGRALCANFSIEIGGEDFGNMVPLRWLKCLDKLARGKKPDAEMLPPPMSEQQARRYVGRDHEVVAMRNVPLPAQQQQQVQQVQQQQQMHSPQQLTQTQHPAASYAATQKSYSTRSLAEARIIARHYGFDPAESGAEETRGADAELLLFLKVFTDAAMLMHFDAPRLRDLVVLRPQWLLDKMRDVLCARTIDARRKEARGATKQALRALRDCGRLDCARVLPSLWPSVTPSFRDAIFAYLVQFDLCCPLRAIDGRHTSALAAVPALFAPYSERPAPLSPDLIAPLPARGPPLKRGWIRKDSDVVAYFCCAHRPRPGEGKAIVSSDGIASGEDARDAFDDECRYLPRTLFHTLVARLLCAGTAGTRAAFARLNAERAVLQLSARWMLLELRPRAHEISVTLRADSPVAGAADAPSAAELLARLVRNDAQLWPALAEKYGVTMRVEVDAPGGARVDLATEMFVETRECAPRSVCDTWRVATAVSEPANGDYASELTTNDGAPAGEVAFDERQLRGPWDFFLSHKQANGGDQVRSCRPIFLPSPPSLPSSLPIRVVVRTGFGFCSISDAFALALARPCTYENLRSSTADERTPSPARARRRDVMVR